MANKTETKREGLFVGATGRTYLDSFFMDGVDRCKPIYVTTDPETLVPGQPVFVWYGFIPTWVPARIVRLSGSDHVVVESSSFDRFDRTEIRYKRFAKRLVCAKLPLYIPRGAIVKPLISGSHFFKAKWLVTTITVIASIMLLFLMLNFATLPDTFSKFVILMHSNPVFWVLLVSGVAYSLWRRYKNPREFLWIELPIQIGISILSLYFIAGTFFYHGSDISDKEIWNGHIKQATYQEVWDSTHCTSCSSNDKDCHVECSCVTSSEAWEFKTNNDETIPISRETYSTLVSQFNNENKINNWGDHCAGHRGARWETKYDGTTDKIVPTAQFHGYVNYIKASETFRRKKNHGVQGYEKYLLPYPQIHSGAFGPIEVDRVLTAGVAVPKAWQDGVDRTLDKALATLGATLQVNVLVYVVGADANFHQALEVAWDGGKKNDVVVLVGVTDFPSIKWVSIMSWAANPAFNGRLRDKLRALGNLADGELFAQQIIDQLTRPPSEAGYARLPMEELAHLAGEANIAYWAILSTAFVYAFAVWLTSWILENNQLRKGGPPPPLDISFICGNCSRQYKVAEQDVCGKDLAPGFCSACTIPSRPG